MSYEGEVGHSSLLLYYIDEKKKKKKKKRYALYSRYIESFTGIILISPHDIRHVIVLSDSHDAATSCRVTPIIAPYVSAAIIIITGHYGYTY